MWKEILDSKTAVLFDLDGTVVDSMWIWNSIDVEYFGRFGLELPHDYQDSIEGLSFYETAVLTNKVYLPDISVETLMNDWNEMAYEHYSNKVLPKEYIRELLDYLKETGKKLGIATSNSDVLCNATLENNGLLGYFDSVITGENAGSGKPAPDVYLRSAGALGANPSECLVFEDLINGIIAGNRAGMTTVAVFDDYSAGQWDEKCRIADHSIISYREIIDEVSEP